MLCFCGWEAVADILEVPHLKDDSRFKERDARKTNRFALTPLLEEKLKLDTTANWVAKLNKAGVPSGEILTLSNALDQEQIKHRNTFKEVQVEGIGNVQLFNLTAKFSETPAMVESPPPLLSEHTNEILNQLGYDESQIAVLKEAGVI